MLRKARGPTQNRDEIFTLLKLASKISPDDFLVLKCTATTSLSIAEDIEVYKLPKFTSNRQDWTGFGRYAQISMANVIQHLGAEEGPEQPEVRQNMQFLFDTLDSIKKEIDETQSSHASGRIRLASKDRKMIAEMKAKLDSALKPFGHHKANTKNPKQVLARVLEMYSDAALAQRPLVGSSASTSTPIPPVSESIVRALQAPVFNTSNTSGGNVTNVAGDFITYIQISSNVLELSYAKGASWNPTLTCLPGTRIEILAEIDVWSHATDFQNVLWLKDVAGSGKSAITHSVAQKLQEDGRLASCFFFSRDVAALSNPQLIFTTMARDIASCDAAIAEDISNTLENEPALAFAHPSRQFEARLQGLCAAKEGKFLLLWSSTRWMKGSATMQTLIFWTSFEMMSQSCATPPCLQIDIHSADNQSDIALYVDAKLRGGVIRNRMGPNWPDEAVIRDLKTLAEGLFIWIVTICNYLRSAYKPREKLVLLLSKSAGQGLPPIKKMDDLYTGILEASGDWEDPDFVKDYQAVVGAVMAAKRPLSLATFKALHGGTFPEDVSPEALLEMLGSVLVGFDRPDEPIRMLHLSFREFVTGRANNGEHTRKFYISEKDHSRSLAEVCLQTMVREFSGPQISGTGYLVRARDDPPGIPPIVGVSHPLLYGSILGVMQEFILRYNTIWIEVVASQSTFRGSLSVRRWLKDFAPELSRFFSEESQAKALSALSYRLQVVNRLEEALTAIQESVDLHQALASKNPTAFSDELASALESASLLFSILGRAEEALSAIEEVMDLRRALAAQQPTVPNADLASSLNILSARLTALGRHSEGLSAQQESLSIRRALSQEQPGVFDAALAQSLNHLSTNLSALGRRDEALIAIQETVSLQRSLAAQQACNCSLAPYLHNLALRLLASNRRDEALMASAEATNILRAHPDRLSLTYTASLATYLGTLSNCLRALGRRDEALIASQQSVDLMRPLSQSHPWIFKSQFVSSLHIHSISLGDLDRREESLAAIQEAMVLYRELATQRPAVFTVKLAGGLTNLAARFLELNRTEEALDANLEAVGLYRMLAAESPAAYSHKLATYLESRAEMLRDAGRESEANLISQELVGMRGGPE
ncbi:hypothetical protein HWV62_40846 [Athelia sp. TMB]|nr:hypothetical protein HWV62_40846 [Athelia sp. TMB]